jgi:hypothetical protein
MSKHYTEIIYPKTRTTRALRARVPLDQTGVHGFTTIPDGTEEIFYETRIDLDALHAMARKAASNQSWVSTDGAVRVRVLATRKFSSKI